MAPNTESERSQLREQEARLVRVKVSLANIQQDAEEMLNLLPPEAVTELKFSEEVAKLAKGLQNLAEEVADLTRNAARNLEEPRSGRESTEPAPLVWRTEADTLRDIARQNHGRGGAFLLGDEALPENKR